MHLKEIDPSHQNGPDWSLLQSMPPTSMVHTACPTNNELLRAKHTRSDALLAVNAILSTKIQNKTDKCILFYGHSHLIGCEVLHGHQTKQNTFCFDTIRFRRTFIVCPVLTRREIVIASIASGAWMQLCTFSYDKRSEQKWPKDLAINNSQRDRDRFKKKCAVWVRVGVASAFPMSQP